ncbi:MAG: ATP-binding protein [Gemmatimonadota bacterium]
MSLAQRAPQLTLDEVQREPDLLLAIKRVIDDTPRRPGRFVLTGSANLLLMERVSESLAGRAGYITLWPFTRRELLGQARPGLWPDLFETPVDDWFDLIRGDATPFEDWQIAARRGGFPVPALHVRSDAERAVWYRSFVQTYLERDLQVLASIDSLGDFQRLMQAAALRLGQVLNQAEVARDVAISRPTAHRYLNLLETSYQTIRLPAYAVNRTKRLIKSPKLYWNDVALALSIAGNVELGGAHLENLIASDLIAWRDAQLNRPGVLYWRTVDGQEVDFVIERGRELLAIEVKVTKRPTTYDASGLRLFANEYADHFRGGLVLHGGDDVFWLAPGILAAPWWKVV